MKIEHIEVKDLLFRGETHSIDISNDIVIFHGLNGCGKTTLMNLMNAALKLDMKELLTLPYKSIELMFSSEDYSDGPRWFFDKPIKSLLIEREGNKVTLMPDYAKLPISITLNKKEVNLEVLYNLDRLDLLRKDVPTLSVDENRLAERYRYRRATIRPKKTGYFSLFESQFFILAEKSQDSKNGEYNRLWSAPYFDLTRTSMIGTNRLISEAGDSHQSLHDLPSDVKETRPAIIDCSREIGRSLYSCKDFFDRFMYTRSASMFSRLVESLEKKTKLLKKDKVNMEEDFLKKQQTLNQMGIYNEENATFDIKKSDSDERSKLKTTEKSIIEKYRYMYQSDFCEAYNSASGFANPFCQKLLTIQKIINSRIQYSGKKIKFSADPNKGLIYYYDDKTQESLDLTKLSSGEQEDFILFYRLLFSTHSGSIVFIDEPEISLHLQWQISFIDSLQNICSENKLQVFISTHSAGIIGDHWDMAHEI